ncbi:hypothetical protein AAFN86_19650 [Roseomonas sp. CAU 1739]|uniref:hypothetical protein n=1 Tax=Roseomonas sp. CAU 1739 TaxID=3140364 RepID=UPI00325B2421
MQYVEHDGEGWVNARFVASERRLTALHEAGHAAMALWFGLGVTALHVWKAPNQKTNVRRVTPFAGLCEAAHAETVVAQAFLGLAGVAAEKVWTERLKDKAIAWTSLLRGRGAFSRSDWDVIGTGAWIAGPEVLEAAIAAERLIGGVLWPDVRLLARRVMREGTVREPTLSFVLPWRELEWGGSSAQHAPALRCLDEILAAARATEAVRTRPFWPTAMPEARFNSMVRTMWSKAALAPSISSAEAKAMAQARADKLAQARAEAIPQMEKLRAELDGQGGVWRFTGLWRGKVRVPARLKRSSYGPVWLLMKPIGNRLHVPSGPTSRVQKELGLHEAAEIAPGVVKMRKDQYAPNGMTVWVARAKCPWGTDAVLAPEGAGS